MYRYDTCRRKHLLPHQGFGAGRPKWGWNWSDRTSVFPLIRYLAGTGLLSLFRRPKNENCFEHLCISVWVWMLTHSPRRAGLCDPSVYGVVCIPNMSTFSRVSFLVSLCVCLHACTQQFTDHQHRLTCIFRRRLDQTAFGLFRVAKHVQRASLILTQSTRVFHSGSGAGLHPWIFKHYGGS